MGRDRAGSLAAAALLMFFVHEPRREGAEVGRLRSVWRRGRGRATPPTPRLG